MSKALEQVLEAVAVAKLLEMCKLYWGHSVIGPLIIPINVVPELQFPKVSLREIFNDYLEGSKQ